MPTAYERRLLVMSHPESNYHCPNLERKYTGMQQLQRYDPGLIFSLRFLYQKQQHRNVEYFKIKETNYFSLEITNVTILIFSLGIPNEKTKNKIVTLAISGKTLVSPQEKTTNN